MENITYFWKNKPNFWKKKKKRMYETLSVRMHTCDAHAHSKHAYAYLGYADAARVPKLYERKAFAFKYVWNESHIIWEPPYTRILPPYKAIKDAFSKGGEYMQDSLENSESKEFFTKHP